MGRVDDEAVVLAANAAFYAAFTTRDVQAMEALLARRAPVTCIHPGWQPLRGREAVLASWQGILGNPDAPAIRCTRASAHLFGDVAVVLCTELLPNAELVATNLFVREDGEWRLAHHQAGGVAQPLGEEDPGTVLH